MKRQVFYEIIFSDESKSGFPFANHARFKDHDFLFYFLYANGFMYSPESDLFHNGATDAWIQPCYV